MTAAIMCLAMAIYAEARGEPEPGQWMIAAIVLNRVESPRYPDNICDVVAQRKQFSFTGQPFPVPNNPQDRQALARAVDIAHLSISGRSHGLYTWDGATNYANLKTATHGWVRKARPLTSVGRHTLLED